MGNKAKILCALVTALMIWPRPSAAQFTAGMLGATACPYGMQVAPGAVKFTDEVDRLKQEKDKKEKRLDELKKREKKLDRAMQKDQASISHRLSPGATQLTLEHMDRMHNSNYYSTLCSGTSPQAPSAGSGGMNVVLPGGSVSPANGSASAPSQTFTPIENNSFCYGDQGHERNYWANFALDNGQVNPSVCDYNFPRAYRTENFTSKDIHDCEDAIGDYYENAKDKRDLEDEISQMKSDVRALDRQIDEANDRDPSDRYANTGTEGTYCAQCAAAARGYQNQSLLSSIIGGVASLGGAYLNYRAQRDASKDAVKLVKYNIDQRSQLGWPTTAQDSAMALWQARNMTWPSQGYASRIPGYMGVYNGMYGAVPGGIGTGAFGCAGTNPYMMMNPYQSMMLPYNNMGSNLFGYPNSMTMGQFPSQFMGAGPWGFPNYGYMNGMYNPANPLASLYGSPYGMGGAPGMLPYPGMAGGMMGSPYSLLGGNGMMGSPYSLLGGSAPGMLGYPGNMMGSPYSLTGMGGGYMNMNPYATQQQQVYRNYSLSVLNTQLQQIQSRINYINGSYGTLGGTPSVLPYPGTSTAPAILPYPGTSTIYPYTTGTSTIYNSINPYYNTTAPVLTSPTNTTTVPTNNGVVRSR